jgi:hypothetical protein
VRAAALVHGHREERVFGCLTIDSERAYIALGSSTRQHRTMLAGTPSFDAMALLNLEHGARDGGVVARLGVV